MKKRNIAWIGSVAVAAVLVALNFTGPIGRASIVNATAQSTKEVMKIDSASAQTNSVVLGDKAQPTQSPSDNIKASNKPQIEVPFNLEVEKGDQKNADAGHSPWKLDPIFVSQVFTSLKVSPEGIQGDYPIKSEELKLVKSSDREAEVEVNSSKTTIKKVYLKRLIKQDNTGIWTVVGYDQAS